MERTIEHWKMAATFWTNATVDAFQRGLELEARDCQTKANEAIATVKAWERDQADKKEKREQVRHISVGQVACRSCDFVMERRPDSLVCVNRNCPTSGIEWELPAIYLRRK